MGVSTNGNICYGIPFKEDQRFPWDEEPYHGDLEKWWYREIAGIPYYQEGIFSNETGDYMPGKTQADADAAYKVWAKKRDAYIAEQGPIWIEDLNYCSGGVPMIMLALKKTCLVARRGYPELFDPTELVVSDEDRQRLIDFCREHVKPSEDEWPEYPELEPCWYLSSYWDQ